VLRLSRHDNEQYLLRGGLKAGRRPGYVLKTAADRDLVEACRAVLQWPRRFCFHQPSRALIRDFSSNARGPGETVPERAAVTPRELEVVKLSGRRRHTSAEIDRSAAWADQPQDGGSATARNVMANARDCATRVGAQPATRSAAGSWSPRGVRGVVDTPASVGRGAPMEAEEVAATHADWRAASR
jgi:hypothetical protein